MTSDLVLRKSTYERIDRAEECIQTGKRYVDNRSRTYSPAPKVGSRSESAGKAHQTIHPVKLTIEVLKSILIL